MDTTTITEPLSSRSLLRLMSWLSPSFPVGAFSYSHGLEYAVHDGRVADADSLEDWLRDLLELGSAWNDAVLVAESWRRAKVRGNLDDLRALGEALAGSGERHLETMRQGAAFLDAAAAWPDPIHADLGSDCPLPVAVGALAGAHGVALEATITAYLHAFTANLIQAALRLTSIGQKQGVEVLSALEPVVAQTGKRAASATLDDLGSATFLAEIATMNHETQHSRLFRS